jgi:acetyl esterase/lipase
VTETPPYLLPFLLDPPRPQVETVDEVDLYLPDAEPRPAVVLLHGGPLPDDIPVRPRAWPAYVGYGSLLAESGLVGVMFEHGYRPGRPLAEALADVTRAIEVARRHPRVDADRVAVWGFSAGGVLLGPFLERPAPWLRAVAATYAYLGSTGEDGVVGATEAVGDGCDVPVLLTRVEQEYDWVAASQREFVGAASGVDLTVIDIPGVRHGFENLDHTDEARAAVHQAITWLGDRLG